MMGQSETLSSSQIIFITLFSAGKHWAVPVTSDCKECTYAEPKPFSWSKPAYFLTFLYPIAPGDAGQGTICYMQISTSQKWGQVWISSWTVQADQRLLTILKLFNTYFTCKTCGLCDIENVFTKQRIFFYSEHCRSQHGHYHWQQHRRSGHSEPAPTRALDACYYSLVDEPQLS